MSSCVVSQSRPCRSSVSPEASPVRAVRRLYDRSRAAAQDVAVTREQSGFLDQPLLQRIASGDKAAVQQCIERYTGLVWSLTRRMCLNTADAEDAVQEIFVEIWRNAYRFDPSVASETTFIAMIARRRLIDRKRRASRQKDRAPLEEAGAAAPAQNLASELGEEAAAAARVMQDLSAEQQRVLRLSLIQGLSHEKIATATGLPLGTVKTHARRGLMRIRELLTGKKMGEVQA